MLQSDIFTSRRQQRTIKPIVISDDDEDDRGGNDGSHNKRFVHKKHHNIAKGNSFIGLKDEEVVPPRPRAKRPRVEKYNARTPSANEETQDERKNDEDSNDNNNNNNNNNNDNDNNNNNNGDISSDSSTDDIFEDAKDQFVSQGLLVKPQSEKENKARRKNQRVATYTYLETVQTLYRLSNLDVTFHCQFFTLSVLYFHERFIHSKLEDKHSNIVGDGDGDNDHRVRAMPHLRVRKRDRKLIQEVTPNLEAGSMLYCILDYSPQRESTQDAASILNDSRCQHVFQRLMPSLYDTTTCQCIPPTGKVRGIFDVWYQKHKRLYTSVYLNAGVFLLALQSSSLPPAPLSSHPRPSAPAPSKLFRFF